MFRRNMVLRMYWDGAKNPSVECPLGDFFGQGWGEEYNNASLPLCAAPQSTQRNFETTDKTDETNCLLFYRKQSKSNTKHTPLEYRL